MVGESSMQECEEVKEILEDIKRDSRLIEESEIEIEKINNELANSPVNCKELIAKLNDELDYIRYMRSDIEELIDNLAELMNSTSFH
jgi:DNA repair exonuclease SbcCD ATPase subunit